MKTRRYLSMLLFPLLIAFAACKPFDEGWQCGDPLMDDEGNSYPTVRIGDQCWMAKNLNIGSMVELCLSGCNQTDNQVIEKYCLNNDIANCELYGGLYQLHELKTYIDSEGPLQGLCPRGWHIPTEQDWEDLEKGLGMTLAEITCQNTNCTRGSDQGHRLRHPSLCTGVSNSNNCGTSGFDAVFTGLVWYRGSRNGYVFDEVFPNGEPAATVFWNTTTQAFNEKPMVRVVATNDPKIGLWFAERLDAYSCRCIRDN